MHGKGSTGRKRSRKRAVNGPDGRIKVRRYPGGAAGRAQRDEGARGCVQLGLAEARGCPQTPPLRGAISLAFWGGADVGALVRSPCSVQPLAPPRRARLEWTGRAVSLSAPAPGC
jgi:hypothetical protein